jgi:hypothetical protein
MGRILAYIVSIAVSLLAVRFAPSAEPDKSKGDIKTAIAKSLPLLLKGAEGHIAQRTCFACHNQGIPILAFTTARDRGFTFRDEDLKKQLQFIADFLDGNREKYREGKGQGGQVDTAGYALYALELGGWQADATTEAVVEYLVQRDKDLDHWRTSGHRPPSEFSDFTPTYLAIRALRKWATPKHADRVVKRIDAVRGWLLKTSAKDTEDQVFRLWGLKEAAADDEDVQSAARDLVQTQRKNGGWAQLDSMESDAYATGSALVALHHAGKLATNDPAYERGIAFLLKTQKDDGSWHVRTRSRPFQTYFESGFPHKKDQFISMAASGWATAALALACPPAARSVALPNP